MFLLLRNLHSGTRMDVPQIADSDAASRPLDAGSVSLILARDQVDRIAASVIDRLSDQVRTLVEEAVAGTIAQQAAERQASSLPGRGVDVQVIDPSSYDLLLEDGALRPILEGHDGGNRRELIDQSMLLETVVGIMSAVFRSVRTAPLNGDMQATPTNKAEALGEGLARGVANVLARALRYHMELSVADLEDDGDVLGRLRAKPQRVEEQFDRLIKKYAFNEFQSDLPLDIAGQFEGLLTGMPRYGGGRPT
jgi:hypothetical protein